MEAFYLQDHIPYSQVFLNNFNGNIFLLEDGIMSYSENILKDEFIRKEKK